MVRARSSSFTRVAKVSRTMAKPTLASASRLRAPSCGGVWFQVRREETQGRNSG